MQAPEMIDRVLPTAKALDPALGIDIVRLAMNKLDVVWDELFPQEQARIVNLLVERVVVASSTQVSDLGDGRVRLTVPIQIKRRRGRMLVQNPTGQFEELKPSTPEPTPLQLALARGHRWLRMLESGQVGSLQEIGKCLLIRV